MGDTSVYACLNIKHSRYENIVKDWKNVILPDIETSFTEWITRTAERSLWRYKYLKVAYPHLKVFVHDKGFVIADSNRDILVKVYMKENEIECSAIEDRDQYIRFALLHPLF